MFKKYRFTWETKDGGKRNLDFFVHSRERKSGGFLHEAVAIGEVPRLDDMDPNWIKYNENDRKLLKKRYHKVTYCNRSWESYSGQTCLSGLWTQIAKMKFTDMGRIAEVNPFSADEEPEHENLWEPEDLFGRFTRRR